MTFCGYSLHLLTVCVFILATLYYVATHHELPAIYVNVQSRNTTNSGSSFDVLSLPGPILKNETKVQIPGNTTTRRHCRPHLPARVSWIPVKNHITEISPSIFEDIAFHPSKNAPVFKVYNGYRYAKLDFSAIVCGVERRCQSVQRASDADVRIHECRFAAPQPNKIEFFACREYFDLDQLEANFCHMYASLNTESAVPFSTNTLRKLLGGNGVRNKRPAPPWQNSTDHLLRLFNHYRAPFHPARNDHALVYFQSSNCGSHRDKFVQALSQLVSVDRCGKCLQNYSGSCIQTDYKFSIALESDDERPEPKISEKLFNAIFSNSLPILNSRRHYEHILPSPHSALFLEDWGNMSELAAHVSYLASNETAYRSYFSWKDQGLSAGFVTTMLASNDHWGCHMCDELHYRWANELSGKQSLASSLNKTNK